MAVDNTFLQARPQAVEVVGDHTLQTAGQRETLVVGQQVMEAITWYEKLSGERTLMIDGGDGTMISVAVDDAGYLTNRIPITAFEVPFVPERGALKLVKFLKGGAKGGTSLWTSTSKMSSVKNAFGHWKKHGAEFPEFINAKQYVEGAKNFMHNSPAGTLMKTRANGDILKYHPGTNTFGVWTLREFQKLCLDLRTV